MPNPNASYHLKWKGQRIGPLTVPMIREKLKTSEVGLMHEVWVDGEWQTVRAFLLKLDSVKGPPKATAEPVRPGGGVAKPSPGAAVIPAMPVAPVESKSRPAAPAADAVLPSAPSGSSDTPAESTSHQSVGQGTRQPNSGGFLIHGGFWMRATALSIDLGLLSLAVATLQSFGLKSMPLQIQFGVPLVSWNGAQSLVPILIILICGWLFAVAFESSPFRATPGKRTVGLIVADEFGNRTTFGVALLRNLIKIPSLALLGGGCFLAAFTPSKQSFHDLATRSTVVRRVRWSHLLS